MSFWRPGTSAPGETAEDERDEGGNNESATSMLYNPHSALSLTAQRARLPIAKVRRELLYALEQHESLVLVGATGCGKSTQFPQYLVESGWTQLRQAVAVSQPRRVAAITLATRVRKEKKKS
jgi:ATP-dependent RNA helicase DDX35